METIKLDLIPGKKMPSLHASQYDDGREHGIDLFENGVAYNLDGTETLTINERKGDDCICSLDIENTFAETNHIVFSSTEQMCAVWGNNICELVIAKGEKTIGTLNFILEIEQSPTEDGIESESEIKNLEMQIEAITEEVIGDNYYTAEETDEAIATAIEGKADTTYVNTELAKKADKTDTYTKTETNSLVSPKADKTYVDSVADTKADKATTYTKTEVDTLIDNLPEPMIFKGTLGVGGTIQSLPTASASNEGWTYKVITDGTYAGQTAKVGDVFTSNGSAWVLIPSGDEDNDTWRAIKVEGVEVLGNGISSGAVDFVGSENIEVEFDGNGNKVGIKTKNIYTKEEVDDIVYNILPDDTASGSVANFETDLALPLKSLEVDINAVQEAGTPTPSSPKAISGLNKISVIHCGKNLYQYDENKVSQGTTTTSTIRAYYPLGFKGVSPLTFTANLKSGSSITASDYLNIGRLRKSDGLLEILSAFITPTDITTRTLSISSDDEVVLMSLEDPTVIKSILSRYDLQIEVGSSASTYESFNGTTAVINLGGTYYGGHFTQDKDGHRQFEVTHVCETFDGSEDENWVRYSQSDNQFRYWIPLSDCKLNANGEQISNYLKPTNGDVSSGNSAIIRNNPASITLFSDGSRLYVNTTNVISTDTKEEWRSYLSTNNLTIVYPLATPIIIDLPDGEPINTFAGTNNIYADTGDTSVVFKCSVNDYINAHSGGNLLGMGGVYLGGAKSGGSEEDSAEESEDTEKTKLEETKVEVKEIGDDSNIKKFGGE